MGFYILYVFKAWNYILSRQNPYKISPKLKDRPILVIEQRGTAKAVFDAFNGIVNSMTKTVIFSHYKPNLCLRGATDYDLYRKIRDINIYREFEMLKSKVLIIFLGMVGFSLPGDRR
jgi:hypothetical protein